ncbi:ROK family protein [Candidatus Calescamantes bacterium]|nr:ROK family protein [Candidatus Calescamantes bacterium]
MEFIGLDLGGTFIKVGVVNEEGKVLRRAQIPTCAEGGRNKVLSQMEKAIRGVWKEGIEGIGIGTPGLVDREGRVFLAPNIPGWDNLPLRAYFEKKFSLPVVVENDVNTITWGEYLFGAGKGTRTMICITLGTGLGGGVVWEGKLLRGTKYSAVEIGHIPINFKGPRCKCGNIGCIERYVGSRYICAMAKRSIKRGRKSLITELVNGDLEKITPKIISDAYKRGDELAREIWVKVGEYLGVLFSGLVNLFNPERIVIGGGVSQAGEILFESVRKTIKERAFAVLTPGLEVVPAGLQQDSGIVSAASLIIRSPF